MALSSTASNLRSAQRRRLLAELMQQAQPLGKFLDEDMRGSAEDARYNRLTSLQGREAGATARAVREMGQIDDAQAEFPGRAPGGTGLTGIGSPSFLHGGGTGIAGYQGYLEMLKEQREQADLAAALSGRPAPTMRGGTRDFSSGSRTLQGPSGGRAASPSPYGYIGPERPELGQPDLRTSGGYSSLVRGIEATSARQLEADEAGRNPELATAKREAAAERFRQRTDVRPVVKGIRSRRPETTQFGTGLPTVRGVYGEGGGTEARYGAQEIGDPNYPADYTRRRNEASLHPNVLMAQGYSGGGTQPTAAGDYSDVQSERMMDKVDDLLARTDRSTVGWGSLTDVIPESPAANYAADIESLASNIAFKELQEMRNASKTGGALGQVSDREGQLLMSSIASLRTKQSPDNMRKNLLRIRTSLERWERAKQELSGGGMTGGGDNVDYSQLSDDELRAIAGGR